MKTLFLELLSRDGKEWNVLQTTNHEKDLEDLKRQKQKWYSTVYSDRQMRIISVETIDGKVVQKVLG